MDDDLDDEELKELRICFDCIGEEYLKAEVEATGEVCTCSYCEQNTKTITIEDLSHTIESAIEEHYYRTSDQPSSWESMLLSDKESSYDWERSGEQVAYVIAQAAMIDELPAEHLRRVIDERTYDFEAAKASEESPFEEEAHYVERGPNDAEFQADWQHFEKSLKTESRLFNREAEGVLASIFEGLATHTTKDGKPVIIETGPHQPISALWRARVFHPDEENIKIAIMRPDINIGSPPSHIALPGRMNARGISVFYGATEPEIALSEVRPPVGSHVIVGRFEIIRTLRLLDVAALQSILVTGSIFDSGYMRRLEKAKFLERLSARIAIPVMPADEPADYLVTQAIADFLSNQTEPQIDGIIYPTVQSEESGVNVVLFHKSSRVEMLDIPDGTEISAHLESSDEDGYYPDYGVWEETPPAVPDKKSKTEYTLFEVEHFLKAENSDVDIRERALRVDTKSLKVHHVERVKYKTSAFPVARRRSEKRDPEF